jgi:hypothetical protein
MKDLLRIASLLDNSGQFHLSDKLFKIAQTAPTNKPIIDENFYQLPMSFKLRKQQELNFALQQFNAKQRNLQERFQSRQITPEVYGDGLRANGIELQSFKPQIDIIDNYIRDYNQNPEKYMQIEQQNEQQNENLISYSPEDFAKKLIDFREEYNITNLGQAFDMYARSGAMYGNNPISRDPRLQKLYQKILQTPRFIHEYEIVSELNNIISGIE